MSEGLRAMKLVSCHVPKCAGFSFQRHLTHLFRKRAIWDYNHTDRPGYKQGPPQHYILSELRHPKKVTVIHGHFFLSKYHNIPNIQRAMWFRHPVDRLLSHYYYWLRGPDMDHPNCRALHEQGLSVVQFAKIPELRNVFTRFLDGEKMTELNWVGIIERYQDSIDLFYAMYATGRDPGEIKPHENKNVAHPEGYELDKAAREEIERLNAEDMRLYDIAQGMFDRLIERYGNGY